MSTSYSRTRIRLRTCRQPDRTMCWCGCAWSRGRATRMNQRACGCGRLQTICGCMRRMRWSARWTCDGLGRRERCSRRQYVCTGVLLGLFVRRQHKIESTDVALHDQQSIDWLVCSDVVFVLNVCHIVKTKQIFSVRD